MRLYVDLLHHVLRHGRERRDRTGTGTISVFGYQMRFSLQEGFPICTTKRVWFRGLACELLWFLSGSTNIKPLVDQEISIWTAWPLKNYLQHQNLKIPPSDSGEWAAYQSEFEDQIRHQDGFAKQWGDLAIAVGARGKPGPPAHNRGFPNVNSPQSCPIQAGEDPPPPSPGPASTDRVDVTHPFHP